MTLDAVRLLLDEVDARAPRPDEPRIDGLSPSLVLEPEDDEACSKALELCCREHLAVVPLGAGTRIELGNTPKRLDVYLSTQRLSGVDGHIPGDLTVAVRAGTTLETLQRELGKEGQFLPLEAPLPSRATLGGIFALGEPGFRRQPGARPRDLLLGFEAILADGTRVKAGGRVVKNVAGYELMKLVVGSSGTLAVLTKAYLRLRAMPEAVLGLATSFRRPNQAAAAFRSAIRMPLPPEAIALLSPASSRVHGLEDWTLLLRFEGFREETGEAIESARETFRGDSVPLAGAIWEEIRDFPARPLGEGDLLLRGQVAPARTFELAERWQDGGVLVAYPDSGIVYSHTEDLDALGDREESATLVGGNVVVERAPSSLKQERDVFGELPEGFPLMKGIKEKLDPEGVLSPGRFVGRL